VGVGMAQRGGERDGKTAGIRLNQRRTRCLLYIYKYCFLTIAPFVAIANFSEYHAGDVLRRLAARGAVGFFGYITMPAHGKTPKVYYLRKKG
jgi:hypothetical protein